MAGTKSNTREQLQEEMRKLNAQVSVGGGGGGGGGRGGGEAARAAVDCPAPRASITAPAENFVPAMRLAVEMLKEPAYPQDDFDRVKTQRIKRSKSRRPSRPSWPANV